MKGEITITKDEVTAMCRKFLAAFLDPIGGRITDIRDYFGSLEVKFTTEPEEKEDSDAD